MENNEKKYAKSKTNFVFKRDLLEQIQTQNKQSKFKTETQENILCIRMNEQSIYK